MKHDQQNVKFYNDHTVKSVNDFMTVFEFKKYLFEIHKSPRTQIELHEIELCTYAKTV